MTIAGVLHEADISGTHKGRCWNSNSSLKNPLDLHQSCSGSSYANADAHPRTVLETGSDLLRDRSSPPHRGRETEERAAAISKLLYRLNPAPISTYLERACPVQTAVLVQKAGGIMEAGGLSCGFQTQPGSSGLSLYVNFSMHHSPLRH